MKQTETILTRTLSACFANTAWLVACLLCLSNTVAVARDFQWNGSVNSNWNNAANWTDLGTGGADLNANGFPDGLTATGDNSFFNTAVTVTLVNLPVSGVGNNFTINNAGASISFGANPSFAGNITITNGTLNGNTTDLGFQGDFTKGAGGTFNQGTSTVSSAFVASAITNIVSSGDLTFHNFRRQANPAGADLRVNITGGNFIIQNTFTLQEGGLNTVTLVSGQLQYDNSIVAGGATLVYNNFNIDGFNVGAEFAVVAPPNNLTVDVTSSRTITLPDADRTIFRDLNIASGTLATFSAARVLNVGGAVGLGTATTTGSFAVGTLVLNQGNAQNIAAGAGTISNLTINKSAAGNTVTLTGGAIVTLTITGNLLLQQGNFRLNTGSGVQRTVIVGGNLTVSGGTYNQTVTAVNNSQANTTVAGNLTISGGTYNQTVAGGTSSQTNTTVTGNLTISGGTYNQTVTAGTGTNSNTIVTGDVLFQSGTYTVTRSAGTVIVSSRDFLKTGGTFNLGADAFLFVSRNLSNDNVATFVANAASITGFNTSTGEPTIITGTVNFGNVEVDKTGGTTITLAGAGSSISTAATSTLIWPNNLGIIITGTNTVSVLNPLTDAIDGFGVDGHIRGDLIRQIASGATSYDFPVADAGANYRPVTFSALAGGGQLLVRVVNVSPRDALGTFITAPDAAVTSPQVSDVRYWQALTNSGTVTTGGTATFSFGANDDAVNDLNTLRIAQGTSVGAVYANEGGQGSAAGGSATNVSVVGGYINGTITSGALTAFNPTTPGMFYTLANLDAVNDNPLPVELELFNSVSTPEGINLTWKTGSEKDSRGFILLRRNVASGEVFRQIASYVTVPSLTTTNTATGASYSYTDTEVDRASYEYRLKEQDINGNLNDLGALGTTAVQSRYVTTIKEFGLTQNYPNPFNPSTTIGYTVAQRGLVKIELYNALGQKVRELVNQEMESGRYSVTLNAINFSSGTYFYRMTVTGNGAPFVQTRKMQFLK